MPEDPRIEKFLDLRAEMGKNVTLTINGEKQSGRLAKVCLETGILLMKISDKSAIPISASLESVNFA